MRSRLTPLAVTAILGGVVLTGCSQATAAERCEPALTSGALSENIRVVGGFDSSPGVEIPEDITFANPQVTITDRAEVRERVVDEPAVVTVNYALFESNSGTIIEQSEGFTTGAGTSFVPVRPGEPQGAFLDALECTAPGDRVIAVLSPEEALAISGSIGAPPETALAILIDVHAVQPMKVQGTPKALPFGFPGVVVNEEGQPGVVATPEPAPSSTRVAVRIEGDGPSVQASDNVVANSLAVSWEGRIVDNAWANGPAFIGNEDNPNNPVREHLTGLNVGSQVIVLVPTEDGSATIHVVDILAAG